MKLRARWNGAPPHVGDYLQSPTRPRFAYRICEITRRDQIVRWDLERKTEFRHLVITAERVALNAVPKLARVHPWRWDKRASREGRSPRDIDQT